MDDRADPAPRPRQLVVCCDGTNNTLTARTEDSNVLRLYEHLLGHRFGDPACERLFYYDPGVGSPDSVPPTDAFDWVRRIGERVSGLASGRGVYDNIAEAYRFLMLNWRGPQDRIYCFGFSRGAFTARCVVGMVNLFGLIEPAHEVMLPTLIRVYFSLPEGERHWWQRWTRKAHKTMTREIAPGTARVERSELAAQVRDDFTGSRERRDARVHWVGVWDTVESVGLPGPLSRSNPSTATFVDKRVDHVRHALAFDEHRWTFEPRLYEEPGDIDRPADAAAVPPVAARSLRQRWFPGVHSDVGGGYHIRESGLADASLAWMVDELAGEFPGLPRFAPVDHEPLRHDTLWDTPWWALTGMCLRDMRPHTSPASGERQAIEVIAAPVPEASASVWERPRKAWPLALAAVLGLVCLLFSGLCLVHGELPLRDAQAALHAAVMFALDQLAALWGGGLLDEKTAAYWRERQPAWAMFWDFGFVLCYGYLVARIASRAFTWLAGTRRAGAVLPGWRWLGMTPLAFVGGDAAENLLTLVGFAWRGVGTDIVAGLSWWFGGVAGVVKFAGMAGCVLLLGVRLWIAMRPAPPAAVRGAG